MTSHPCHVLAVTKTEGHVINDLRNDIGPTDPNQAKQENPNSLRAMFGTDDIMNAIHASDGEEVARR
jgi:nucleoside diphosphate kinase